MRLTQYIAVRYIGITIIVLLIAGPFTYFLMRAVLNSNTDESMRFQKHWIEEKLQTTSPENFVSFNNNIIIRPGNDDENDERLYDENIYVPDDNEMVLHRVLEFNTTVKGNRYFVRIQKSLVENDDILGAIIGIQLLILIILLFFMLYVNKLINKRIWSPFYQTLEKLNQFRIDKDEPLQLPEVSTTELNNLNQSLNELTKHNHDIFIAQKEFTENSSHELQTPLAVMQSDLDLLWQTSPISKEQAKLLQNLTQTNSQMSKLNKSLLLLAKIDNNQYNDKRKISLNPFVERLLAQYEPVFSQRNIRVTKKLDSDTTVFADETLVESLLGNLISNALRYTPENGNVDIELSDKAFKISNSSFGQSLDKEKLFRRFQKQNNKSQSGNGLGLEICKRICALNNWEIQYDFIDNKHWVSIAFSQEKCKE